ncbi:MAG TPA: M20 family metallopeptidase [Bacteroidia bacterium]|nr:M20 family metallopeptidase [Bacteroidia bacterium]
MEKSIQKIKQLASSFLGEITAVRRHLHMYPELSFKEFKTADYISDQLKALNIPHQKGIVETGIVAIIEGRNPASAIIALRADMDALPINESNDVDYKSKNSGIMHACGHDVHSASLIGAAKILTALKDDFEGTIKLIFQPGEEKLPGGASLMIKQGVLENPKPQSIFAQHVFPSLETGKVGFKSGMYMASTDEIYLTIKGKGGHAAMPEHYNNPIYIAAEILLALQQEFMHPDNKNIPDIPTVLAFGKFMANGATNVIPDEVKVEGTFRTMDEQWRTQAHKKMKELAEKIAIEKGGTCEFEIRIGYPYLENSPQTTEKARNAAEEYLGKENIVELSLRMTAEDFSFYTQHIPGCFYRLGTANSKKGITSGVHTSTFDIDEKALETGMGLLAFLAVNELKSLQKQK